MTTNNDWNEIERQFHWTQDLLDWLMVLLGLAIMGAIIVVWLLV